MKQSRIAKSALGIVVFLLAAGALATAKGRDAACSMLATAGANTRQLQFCQAIETSMKYRLLAPASAHAPIPTIAPAYVVDRDRLRLAIKKLEIKDADVADLYQILGARFKVKTKTTYLYFNSEYEEMMRTATLSRSGKSILQCLLLKDLLLQRNQFVAKFHDLRAVDQAAAELQSNSIEQRRRKLLYDDAIEGAKARYAVYTKSSARDPASGPAPAPDAQELEFDRSVHETWESGALPASCS